jgi:hypothetical protein
MPDGVVGQDSYSVNAEGSFPGYRLNRRAEVVVPDFYMQLAADGRIFNASNAVQETLEDISETARGTNNVNPALLLDIPSGTTAFPMSVILDVGADGTDQDIALTINTDDGVRYSSGGVAITPINMRKDDPLTAAGSFYSGSSTITTAVNVDDDTIYSARIAAEGAPRTTVTGTPSFHWSSRVYPAPVLVGPASFLVFAISAAADQTYNWSVTWAEIPTVQAV